MGCRAEHLVALAAVTGAMLMTRASFATCFDRIRNGPESDIDCGGDCLLCTDGKACRIARDCLSGYCSEGVCEERPYESDEPVPPGYRVELSERDSAALARRIGFVSLGVSYGAAYVSALALPGRLSWMLLPVAGPWILVADETQPKRGLLALDGAVQGVGFCLLVGGIIAAGHHLVRDQQMIETGRLVVVPTTVGRSGYGVGLGGVF